MHKKKKYIKRQTNQIKIQTSTVCLLHMSETLKSLSLNVKLNGTACECVTLLSSEHRQHSDVILPHDDTLCLATLIEPKSYYLVRVFSLDKANRHHSILWSVTQSSSFPPSRLWRLVLHGLGCRLENSTFSDINSWYSIQLCIMSKKTKAEWFWGNNWQLCSFPLKNC